MDERQPGWRMPIREDLNAVIGIIEESIAKMDVKLRETIEYAIKPYGKMIRPSVFLLAYYACGGKSPENVRKFAAAAELLHTATLIHDDINDKSDQRRGKPTAYRLYGAKKALTTGDMLLLMSLKILKDDLDIYTELLSGITFDIVNSEFEQIKNEYNVDITEEKYLDIISGKTAIFFSQCCRIGALRSGASDDVIRNLETYGLLYGLGFQMADDLIDAYGAQSISGKSVGIDLETGKMTLPTILAMDDPVYGTEIRKLIEKRGDTSRIHYLISQTDAFEKCKMMIDNCSERAVEMLDVLDDSAYKDALIELVRESTDRRS